VNSSVFSSSSLASIILEYICYSVCVFKLDICCSLWFCIFFLTIEKLNKASTGRPDTIVAEIRRRYDKMDSTIFIVENPDN
jgi:hypothetical protein